MGVQYALHLSRDDHMTAPMLQAMDGFRGGPVWLGVRALGGQIGRVVILVLLASALIWSLAQLVRKASIFDCLFLVYP